MNDEHSTIDLESFKDILTKSSFPPQRDLNFATTTSLPDPLLSNQPWLYIDDPTLLPALSCLESRDGSAFLWMRDIGLRRSSPLG